MPAWADHSVNNHPIRLRDGKLVAHIDALAQTSSDILHNILRRNKAETSRNTAEKSKNKAEKSRNRVEMSRNKAETSRNTAEKSKNKAHKSCIRQNIRHRHLDIHYYSKQRVYKPYAQPYALDGGQVRTIAHSFSMLVELVGSPSSHSAVLRFGKKSLSQRRRR
jgi:hypothetical protein